MNYAIENTNLHKIIKLFIEIYLTFINYEFH